MLRELCAIQAACTKLEKDYKPQITFIIVQKRHHTRFFLHDVEQKRNAHARVCGVYFISNKNLFTGT